MPAHILDVALEIRNKIYEELLVFDVPIEIMTNWGVLRGGFTNGTKSFRLWLSILRVSKRIKIEACTILYSRNAFKFVTSSNTFTLTPFLNSIGPKSASFIRRICIEFPTFENNDFDEMYGIALPIGTSDETSFKLDDASTQTLRAIKNNCTSLTTLELSLQSIRSLKHKVDGNGCSQLDTNVITILDKELRSLPELLAIIVDVHVGHIDGAVKRAMNRCGWTIKSH